MYFFCEESNGKLHQFSTLEADSTIRVIAKDTSLIAKIEGGDLIALESKYHLDCLTKLCNHRRSYLSENSDTLIKERKMEARAFAEQLREEGTFLFKSTEHCMKGACLFLVFLKKLTRLD